MKILLADDHAVVRRGLRQILAEALAGAEFGEAANAQEAVECVRRQTWDVLVLDITMPGRNGLDVLKAVQLLQPALRVLILSIHPEDQYALRTLKAGAAGYLTKEKAPEELVQAVRKVLAGGIYVSGPLAEKLAGGVRTGADRKPLHALLSDRELEVLCLLARGRTIKEIGAELALSIKTVSTYRTRLLEKMGLRTTAELMRYAVDHDLTS